MVKKADGTTERVPLRSLAAYATRPQPKPEPVAMPKESPTPQATPEPAKKEVLSIEEKKQPPQLEAPTSLVPTLDASLSNETPVKDYFVDAAAAARMRADAAAKMPPATQKVNAPVVPNDTNEMATASTNGKNAVQWGADDHTSLLDDNEDMPEPHEPVSSATEQKVTRVIETLPFDHTKEDDAKLQPVVLSAVKGIRSDEQLHALLVKDARQGGMGYDSAKAAQVIATTQMVMDEIVSDSDDAGLSEAGSAPSVAQAVLPTNSPLPNMVRQEQSPSIGVAPARQSIEGRPALHDVVPVVRQQKQTVGPKDEMGTLTVLDFRRLSSNPAEATASLMQKLQTLKKESYILYAQAKDAWFHSQLFMDYANAVAGALNSGQSLPQYLSAAGGDEAVTMEDMLAIAEFNKSL